MAEYACSHAYRMPWLRLDSVGPAARRSDGAAHSCSRSVGGYITSATVYCLLWFANAEVFSPPSVVTPSNDFLHLGFSTHTRGY